MEVRILNGEEVEGLLPMEECIEVMARALETTARGDAVLPLRSMVWKPDRSGMIGVMPAYLGAPESLGLKVVSIFPKTQGSQFDSHQGAVLLFDTRHGSPMAVMDAGAITAIRTAAVSGVATRILARPDAGDLTILGSGVQARTHLEAMSLVRPLRRVRVWSRSLDHARAFAERESRQRDLTVEAARSAREAIEGADLICTATAAREPIVEGDRLAPGAHLNAVGACFAAARELDTAAVTRARLFVDRRESALHEAGDFLIPKREGVFGDEHILGELGDLLLHRVQGRRTPHDITLFKSLGIAVEDLAAAHHVHRKALETGTGISVPLGGRRVAPA